MIKTIPEMKLYTLQGKGYKGGPGLADLLEYCQDHGLFKELMSLVLIDSGLTEQLYQIVKENVST